MGGISTVFWDVGGVLLTNGWDRYERAIVLKDFGLDAADYDRRHATVYEPWEKGLIDADEYLATTVFYEPREFTPEDFLAAMKAQSKELPNGGLGVLREMAASQELKLAVLNNESRELNEHRFQEFGLAGLFEAFLSSCYLGFRKPDPVIYRRALDILQLAPGETAFIDDRAENVGTANQVGMHGIRFQSPSQLGKELEALGIAIAA